MRIITRLVRKAALGAYQLGTISGVTYAKLLGVKCGTDCRFYSPYWGSEPFLIEIGDNVIVSILVNFLTHDAAATLVVDERGRRYSFGRIKIGSNVFIGAGATILPGVEIGDNSIVGAASVVTKLVPSGTVVAGNPARFICTFEEYRKKTLQFKSQADAVGGDYETRVRSLMAVSTRPPLRALKSTGPCGGPHSDSANRRDSLGREQSRAAPQKTVV